MDMLNKLAILDRAFDKAAKDKPEKLYPMEEKILLEALDYSYKLFRIRKAIYRYGEEEVQRVGFIRIGRKYDY